MNKKIEDEYFRLVQEKTRPVEHRRESRLAKFLGIRYLTGSDSSPLHSSTVFVEFTSIAAKQEAIQCNITGTSKYVTVTPVPEARDIIWRNMHLSKVLVETRRAWLNAALFGGLIFWSFLVSVIRDYDDISDWFDGDELSPAIVAFLDFYVPALVVEGLVRCIGLLIRALCKWVRFKSFSDIDHYVVRWYFAYRLMTFAFLILGASILEKFDEIEDDAVGLIKSISDNVVENATFFVSYVIVSQLLARGDRSLFGLVSHCSSCRRSLEGCKSSSDFPRCTMYCGTGTSIELQQMRLYRSADWRSFDPESRYASLTECERSASRM